MKQQRLIAYGQARGGWPMPLAGALYWLSLAGIGYFAPHINWALIAAYASGAIFLLAILISKIFKSDFMKVKAPDQGVIYMAMIGMLILAIGLYRHPAIPRSFSVDFGHRHVYPLASFWLVIWADHAIFDACYFACGCGDKHLVYDA